MFEIELTDSENALLALLSAYKNEPFGNWENVSKAQHALFSSLAERDAIPSHRIKWFLDPAYNIGGRNRSRKDNFEINGTKGNEIAFHPHFLKYLFYFIFGPDLPVRLMREFSEYASNLEPITSGDIDTLRKEIRRLCRAFCTQGCDADEVYKLCLEINLENIYAESIRKAVKQT